MSCKDEFDWKMPIKTHSQYFSENTEKALRRREEEQALLSRKLTPKEMKLDSIVGSPEFGWDTEGKELIRKESFREWKKKLLHRLSPVIEFVEPDLNDIPRTEVKRKKL